MYLSSMRNVFWFLIFFVSSVDAQQTNDFSRELLLQIDNDALLLQVKDGYYSSGLYLKLAIADSGKGGHKRIHSWEVGQQLYTPKSRAYVAANRIDRPFAGYLYLKYAQRTLLRKEQQLDWSLAAGVLGPASGAQNFQNWYHNLMNYAIYPGWDKQIPNNFALDAGVQYTAAIRPRNNSIASLFPNAQLNLGTTFSNLRAGACFVLGKTEALGNSALFNNRISKQSGRYRHTHELMFYYHPTLTWQWYNATIQGGLFNKGDARVITANPNRMFPEHRLGFCYARNRSTLRIEVVHQAKEAITQTHEQNFGVIGFAYRFR
jgi:hypothetical protein